jgi:hypothetical protein
MRSPGRGGFKRICETTGSENTESKSADKTVVHKARKHNKREHDSRNRDAILPPSFWRRERAGVEPAGLIIMH